MSFKINFGASNIEDKEQNCQSNESKVGDTPPCREIKMAHISELDVEKSILYQFGEDLCLRVLDSRTVEQIVTDRNLTSDLVTALQARSDLVPRLYEGGLKVWECSVDLVDYLHTNEIDMVGKTVLELGCGAGLPGIYAAVAGASQVYLQDYNEEVIEHYTIPNFQLNTTDSPCSVCGRFFSGDWTKFEQTILRAEKIRFDIILTSETIYEPQNYQRLHSVLDSCLEENGTIFLAAKSYYFGVGGSTSEFEDFCSRAGSFELTATHNISAGVPRKIMVLKRSKDPT